MASVHNYLPHHKLFGAASLDRRASSPGRHRAPFLAHRRDLHAHARDTADPCGGYDINDLLDNSPPPFHGIDTLVQVSSAAPALPSSADLRASAGTSSRRRRRSVSPHLWPQRAAGISHAPYHRPSPPSRSPHRERYQRAEVRAAAAPASTGLGWKTDVRALPAGHGYEEGRGGASVRAEWQTTERLYSSREHHRHDHYKRSFSPLQHSPTRKSPVLVMVDKPLVDDGNKSPTDWPDSPVYCYQNYLKMISGHYGDENNNCGAYDGSEITGRDLDCKYEDRSYDGLVNDFMDAVVENWREPTNFDPAANHELYQKQTKELAELALKRYNKNKNNKVKFSLVEAVDGAVFSEESYCYAHVNFYAKAKNGPNKNGAKLLVFAELHHVGRRLNAMALTSFQLLDDQKQFPGCRKLVRNSCSDQDRDIYHCYACSGKIKHPEGSRYKAGHFVDVSYYYED